MRFSLILFISAKNKLQDLLFTFYYYLTLFKQKHGSHKYNRALTTNIKITVDRLVVIKIVTKSFFYHDPLSIELKLIRT